MRAKAIWSWRALGTHGKHCPPNFFLGDMGVQSLSLIRVKAHCRTECPELTQGLTWWRGAKEVSVVGEEEFFFASMVKDQVSLNIEEQLDRCRAHTDGGTHVVVFGVFVTEKVSPDFALLAQVLGDHDGLAVGRVPDEVVES